MDLHVAKQKHVANHRYGLVEVGKPKAAVEVLLL